jgi:protein O-mannosyl-transferase
MTKKPQSLMTRLSEKMNVIKPWRVACIIAVVGLAVFATGLHGGFQGDDNLQIVDNVPVHSLANIGTFFGASTFWNGESLIGSFYRPIMTTTFSFVYSLFGAQPIAFHVVQLILYMAAAFVFYLFFTSLFKPGLALAGALVFLVHPINSQAVFAIPSMQEPLFMLFGLLAIYTLSQSQSRKSLIIASGWLLLSMLSKETGVVFVAISLLYFGLFHRPSVIPLIKIGAIAAVIYVILRAAAVGIVPAAIHAAPISTLGFGERMMTLPSIIWFYITQTAVPTHLATSYYWTNSSNMWAGFWVPLLLIILTIAVFVIVGRSITARATRQDIVQYVFFASWAVIGMLPYLQIIPLDMTACETWVIASVAGVIGMILVAVRVYVPVSHIKWVYIATIVIVVILGVRTSVRGLDYANQYTLASVDIAHSPGNYLAMNNAAQSLIRDDKLDEALAYTKQSTQIFPAVTNYTNMGVIYQKQSKFVDAKKAYEMALTYGSLGITYENLGIVNLTIGAPDDNVTFYKDALTKYPRNNRLWIYAAMQYAEMGQREQAKLAISTATTYGPVPGQLYSAIMNQTALDVPLPGSERVVRIPQG